jgi:hypothetical protein
MRPRSSSPRLSHEGLVLWDSGYAIRKYGAWCSTITKRIMLLIDSRSARREIGATFILCDLLPIRSLPVFAVTSLTHQLAPEQATRGVDR